jgi:hypothetical protein
MKEIKDLNILVDKATRKNKKCNFNSGNYTAQVTERLYHFVITFMFQGKHFATWDFIDEGESIIVMYKLHDKKDALITAIKEAGYIQTIVCEDFGKEDKIIITATK